MLKFQAVLPTYFNKVASLYLQTFLNMDSIQELFHRIFEKFFTAGNEIFNNILSNRLEKFVLSFFLGFT